MYENKVIVIVVLLMLCVKFSNNASLSIYEQKRYKQLIDGQGLYTESDDVEILTKKNFNERLYEQKNSWVIEFYNSWCGFCQRFAPSWKALATDIRNWKDKVNVGAIDCADDDNNVICRDFEVMAYPTLRYFHENYKQGQKQFGEELSKGEDEAQHKRYLLQKIQSQQKDGRAQQFPNLLPYEHANLNHLFDDISLNTKYVFLFIEKDTDYGIEVAIELSKTSLIAIKYARASNTDLIKNLGIINLPHLLVVSDSNESEHFPNNLNSREGFKTAVLTFLKTKSITVTNGDNDNKSTEKIFTGKWLDAKVPDITSLLEARERKVLREKIKKMGDVVFQGDLETALRYSLKHEIANTASIGGDKRKALRMFLNVVLKYFPLTNNGRTMLFELSEKVNAFDPVYGVDVTKIINKIDDPKAKMFSSNPQWLACDGSSSKHRGYPCGLWKLFHYMTVNAALSNSDQPKEVLEAMHGYIKHFFGCADCSQHFQKMTENRNINGVSSADDAVLWLWASHNVVNNRLAGDTTEDPEYPKIQFPTQSNCPTCRRNDDTFIDYEILKYLKTMYNNHNVRYIGSDTTLLMNGLERNIANDTSIIRTIDSSMCLILYIASLFLIVILIRMFLKRGYRKKMYVHDLLGKV